MADSPEDRRRAERVAVNFEFKAAATAPTFVADLSEYGVFVQTDKLMPMGAEVDLRFTILLEDPVVLEGRGRVVRHQQDPRGMGFEFTALDPEMILRINDVVQRNRPRDSGPPIGAAVLASSRAVPGQLRRAVVQGDAFTVKPHRGARPEEDEAAQTLVNLRAVDVEIIEDEDLPTDDGRDLSENE